MPSMKSPSSRMNTRISTTATVGFVDTPSSRPSTLAPKPFQARIQAKDVAIAIRNIAAAVVTAASISSFPTSLNVSVR